MELFAILFFLFFLIICAVPDKCEDKKITLDEINIGDRIKIKGQTFLVKNYSQTGVMEIIEDEKSFFIKVDDNTIITSHNEGEKRKYLTIDNFKGTVEGQYLDKIKFK